MWVLGIIANYIALWAFGVDLSLVFNYIQTAFLGVSAAYFTKSGIENIKGYVSPAPTTPTTPTDSTNGNV